MTDPAEFPAYISRPEEGQILEQADQVRADRASRVVLLYGHGGAGKTSLVRELAQASHGHNGFVWAGPIDMDDSEYWLLSNLEQQIIEQIDPGMVHFGPYHDYLVRLPARAQGPGDHDTAASRLGRVKQIFAECYARLVEETGATVVLTFDTVEAVRGLYLLLTLTQWMKALPATLFVLSGRPPSEVGPTLDPIRRQLEDPYQGIPVRVVSLGDFAETDAREYLSRSPVAALLTDTEIDNLVRLSRGHPLWLALTIDYLADQDLPPEAAESEHDAIHREVPYTGELPRRGLARQVEFKRRLVTPYRNTDFWHEAVKRLAVIRHGINKDTWQKLMSDRPLPDDVPDMGVAWTRLLRIPWIRPRANRHYVTLHDAVAEELAQLIIPINDLDRTWRQKLWERAVAIYSDLIGAREADVGRIAPQVDEQLSAAEAPSAGNGARQATGVLVEEVAALDVRKRRLDHLRTARLQYRLLSARQAGCEEFLELFGQARSDNDVIFQDLLAFEMQRFLPGEAMPYAADDVVGQAMGEVRDWLRTTATGQHLYLQIGLMMVAYLIKNEQPEAAGRLLANLPSTEGDHAREYSKAILRGNIVMRLPNQARDAVDYFQLALREAEQLPSPERESLMAKAHKEIGFYYRNEGEWQQADDAYQEARDIIGQAVQANPTPENREEMASIQTNWAYVKGLTGNYREGQNLVESAITIRHRLGQPLAEGQSWSVCGEVYRYERRFDMAWHFYGEAERIFLEQRNWPWLGLLYQEQAICLYQAGQDGAHLPVGNPAEEARRLILLSLDICSDQAILSYPSALNRAARILGDDDAEQGLAYLLEGIRLARELHDGWFLFANLLEYAELSYRAWVDSGLAEQRYLDQVAAVSAEVENASRQYHFPDLEGRWKLLQGHIAIRRFGRGDDVGDLDDALRDYATGFAMMADKYVGSSGASAIPAEFRKFGELFSQLPPDVRAHWLEELRRSWTGVTKQDRSNVLLARLEELY